MAIIELELWRGYVPSLPHTRAPGFDPLAGEGVRFAPGRWHTRHQGRYLVYASEHPALALCELLAHDDGLAEVVLVGFVLRAPGLDEIPRRQVAAFLGPEGYGETQKIGDRWYASGDHPVLRVPSVLLPLAHNFLIKPRDPRVSLRVVREERLEVDARLRCT